MSFVTGNAMFTAYRHVSLRAIDEVPSDHLSSEDESDHESFDLPPLALALLKTAEQERSETPDLDEEDERIETDGMAQEAALSAAHWAHHTKCMGQARDLLCTLLKGQPNAELDFSFYPLIELLALSGGTHRLFQLQDKVYVEEPNDQETLYEALQDLSLFDKKWFDGDFKSLLDSARNQGLPRHQSLKAKQNVIALWNIVCGLSECADSQLLNRAFIFAAMGNNTQMLSLITGAIRSSELNQKQIGEARFLFDSIVLDVNLPHDDKLSAVTPLRINALQASRHVWATRDCKISCGIMWDND
ncbi:MAG: hypothetical protein O3A01_02845 [bacterium]|nr:hypothetical protein [bacterium]